MSFHGVPRRSLDLGDPYHCECHKTGRLLAESLGLSSGQYRVTFQSRFGKAEWLQPYTDKTLEELGRAKTRRVDIALPGFRGRLPGNPGGDRLGGQGHLPQCRRRRVPPHPGPQRPSFWIRRPGRPGSLPTYRAGWRKTTTTMSSPELGQRLQRARALGAKN
jgi:hypothetical protein